MPYAPSPAIPAGMNPGDWQRTVAAIARSVELLVAKAQRNGRLGVGDASKYATLVETLQTLNRLNPTDARISAAALGPLLEQMRASLGDVLDTLPEHAQNSVEDLTSFLGAAGQGKVGSGAALAATTARVSQSITNDWTRLASRTRTEVVTAITQGMAGGLNPKEVARQITNLGGLAHARALTIARTEMADLYDSARLGWMGENTDVVRGWWWRARPDACPMCQILHGEQFAPDEAPDRHHNCRCVMVPIPDGANPPPEARPRPRASIVTMLPKSWRDDLPADLTTLVGKRDNPGWRPSRVLRRPGGRATVGPPPGWERSVEELAKDRDIERLDRRWQSTTMFTKDYERFVRDRADSRLVQSMSSHTPATDAERALFDYTIDSRPINGALRGEFVTDKAKAQATALRDAIAQAEPVRVDMVTYRGLDMESAALSSLKPGQLLNDAAFMSTTADARIAVGFAENEARPVLFRIRVPTGTQAIAAGHGDNMTGELLLQCNTTLKVLGRSNPMSGMPVYDVEVMLP